MIEVKNLSFSYNDKHLIKEFSYEFIEGHRYAITGKSGIGKTTLLRILSRLEKGYTGEISFSRDKLSAVFQEDRLITNMNAIENVRLGNIRGIYKDCLRENDGMSDRALIERHLSLVNLNEAMNKKVEMLSGGEKRRVAIVRAIMSDCDYVIMDEPFTGLDQDTKKDVIQYIINYIGERTLIVVTHDMQDINELNAEVICDIF